MDTAIAVNEQPLVHLVARNPVEMQEARVGMAPEPKGTLSLAKVGQSA